MKVRFPLGALVGAAAGLVAGVLTAPKSGKETRKDIVKKSQQLRSATSDVVETVVNEVKTVADSAVDAVSKDKKKKK